MRHFALIPAAGSGSRMGADCPKQYLPVAGAPVLAHTLRVLASHPAITQVLLVVAPDDVWWEEMVAGMPHLGNVQVACCGGQTRAASVANGLEVLATVAGPDDWVLVHDAARPCLTHAMMDRLLTALADDAVGGLLAIPVADTLKRADGDQRVVTTVPRVDLWRAQTPQMFRHALLTRALRAAGVEHPTDEAAAVEALGLAPRLVPGDERNIKVTFPADLALAASYLAEGIAGEFS